MNVSKLSYKFLSEKINNPLLQFSLPQEELISLPEKVLQFGTGCLLRGLPDYLIDKANKKGIFNGRIVAVKSTETHQINHYKEQDNLFVHTIRGLNNGNLVKEYIVNLAISRVIEAKNNWQEVLQCAHNPDLSIIISNTTEVGIYFKDESIEGNPPTSFPAKLTAFLFERYNAFKGDPAKGMIVIPTELIEENGAKLKEIVIKLSRINKLGDKFLAWLEKSNFFCNSLVDRIVTAKKGKDLEKEIYEDLEFYDQLLTISEPYLLWAIQGDTKIREKLAFAEADNGVIIKNDIREFKERKLRLLNGVHTISVGLGYLSGFNTVKDCMEDSLMQEFIEKVMMDEIVPAIEVERFSAEEFAHKVLERFSNPFIDHQLLNISFQYSHKMNVRNVKTIVSFYKKFIEVPRHFALGFAAYILFMKVEKEEDGKYFGIRDEEYYLIQDDYAEYFYQKWKFADLNTINSCRLFVEDIIDEEVLWGKELKTVDGFSDAVAHSLFELVHKGAKETLEEFVEFGEIEE